MTSRDASWDDAFEKFTDYLDDHHVQDWEADDVSKALDKMDDDEIDDLRDFLDSDPSYDEFADYCEEHDIRYH